MIEGIKIKDWDFIFDQEDSDIDKKFNDIIDKYFDNAENEASKITNPLIKMRKFSQIRYYKTHVRRKGRLDDGWLLEIPTYGLYKRQIPITKIGKKQLIKDQIVYLADMLSLIRSFR